MYIYLHAGERSRKDARSEAIQRLYWGTKYMKDLLPSEEGALPRASQTPLSAAYKRDIKSGCKTCLYTPCTTTDVLPLEF